MLLPGPGVDHQPAVALAHGDRPVEHPTQEAPGLGLHWGPEAHHRELPRGERVEVGTVGSMEQILFGPSRTADGTTNLIGALRRAMATTGYLELKEFQRVGVVVSPHRQS